MPILRILAYSPKPESLAPAVTALASQGYEVGGTTNEAEALNRLRSGACDVLLMSVPASTPDAAPWTATLVRTSNRLGVAIPGGPSLALPVEAPLENLSIALRELRAKQASPTPAKESVLPPPALGADFLDGVKGQDELPARVVEALARVTGMRVWAFWQTGPAQEETLSTAGVPPPGVREMARWARERGPLTVGPQATAGWVPPRGADPNQAGIALPLKLTGEAMGAAVLLATGKAPDLATATQAAAPLVALLAALLEQRKVKTEAAAAMQQAQAIREAMERREQEMRALNKLMQAHQEAPPAAKEEPARTRTADFLRVFANLADTGDAGMAGLSEKVAQWGALVAKSIGANADVVTQAALLRDVGMPRGAAPPGGEALRRQQELKHPYAAELAAKALGLPLEVQLAVRHHHESYNGTGYPDSLKEQTIPMASRVLRAVEDYLGLAAAALPPGEALLRLRQQGGKAYDPAVLDALEKVALSQPAARATGTEMISTVTHELRSPLTFLVGYSELLASQEDLPKEAQARAKEIHQEALHMTGLVEDLLQASRYESGRVQLNRKDVSLFELVTRAVAKAKLQAKKHNILTDVSRELPPLKADPDKLQEVIDNLLDNAIKYSPNGGLIGVRAEVNGPEVVVSVSDTGVGLNAEQKKRLFDKFYRADSPLKDQVPGTGLGLYLCKHILEAHGGRIWVESEEGEGSTFSFALPL